MLYLRLMDFGMFRCCSVLFFFLIYISISFTITQSHNIEIYIGSWFSAFAIPFIYEMDVFFFFVSTDDLTDETVNLQFDDRENTEKPKKKVFFFFFEPCIKHDVL